jgi:hypothetical protein
MRGGRASLALQSRPSIALAQSSGRSASRRPGASPAAALLQAFAAWRELIHDRDVEDEAEALCLTLCGAVLALQLAHRIAQRASVFERQAGHLNPMHFRPAQVEVHDIAAADAVQGHGPLHAALQALHRLRAGAQHVAAQAAARHLDALERRPGLRPRRRAEHHTTQDHGDQGQPTTLCLHLALLVDDADPLGLRSHGPRGAGEAKKVTPLARGHR